MRLLAEHSCKMKQQERQQQQQPIEREQNTKYTRYTNFHVRHESGAASSAKSMAQRLYSDNNNNVNRNSKRGRVCVKVRLLESGHVRYDLGFVRLFSKRVRIIKEHYCSFMKQTHTHIQRGSCNYVKHAVTTQKKEYHRLSLSKTSAFNGPSQLNK